MAKVRIGLIGCGGIARWHLQNLAAIPEAEVVALADPSSEQLDRCRAQFPKLESVPTVSDYRELLEMPDVDAVEISTPHDQHFEQLMASFAKGKHVLIEKPFVGSPEQAESAIKARDESGKVGLLAYQRHTQAEFRWLRKRIQAGELGQIQGVAALLGQEWKRFTNGTWRQDPDQSGGGMLNDSGSHILDVLHWCTGLEPEFVAAFGDLRGAPVDINSAATVQFRGGAVGTITIMGDATNWHEDLTIWGERGTVYLRQGRLTVVDEDGNRLAAEELRSGSNPDANFVGAILRGEEVASPFEAALPVLRLTAAIYRSQRAGGARVEVYTA